MTGATVHAARIGLRRGATEFRQQLAAPQELVFDVLVPAVILIVLYFLRDDTFGATSLSLAALALPGVVGMFVVFTPLTGGAFVVAFEREDGTLLRARAAPHGIVGYVAGQVVRLPLYTLISVVLVLVPGVFLFEQLANTGLGGWLTLLWVLVLGLLATVPLGLALGALASNPRAISGWLFFGSGGLIAISGIFYPITALPGWLHPIAQVFPFYWLGLGMRSALLPDAAAAVELYGSWRHVETVLALGGWAIVGLVLAPILLSRMARGVSGATVEQGRRQAAQRIG